MFKALFDSFFVVGAKEKPMPSFLAAYILTWLVLHHQVFPAFFNAESKSLYNRILMAINSVPAEKHHWLGAIFLTLFVVLIRFILNNVIYTFRESSDKFFQLFLQKFKLKTYVTPDDHEALQQHYSTAQKNLFEARKSSEDANKEKVDAIAKHGEFELHQKKLENQLKEKESTILEMSQSNSNFKEQIVKSTDENDSLYTKLNDSNRALDSKNLKVNSLEEQLSALKIQHDEVVYEHDEKSSINKDLTEEIKKLKQEALTENGLVDDLKENIKSMNREEETLRHSVRKLTNKNSNLMDMLAKSTLELNEIQQISTTQELIDKVKRSELDRMKTSPTAQKIIEKTRLDGIRDTSLAQQAIENAGLGDVNAISRAKKINEDFKLAGLADMNAISRANKITDEVKLAGLGGVDATSRAKKINEDFKLAGLRDLNAISQAKKITDEVKLSGLGDLNAISQANKHIADIERNTNKTKDVK